MHPFAEQAIPSATVGIHWFGQNSFALKNATGTILLTDPYFPRERPPEKFIHAEPPLNEADLPADFDAGLRSFERDKLVVEHGRADQDGVQARLRRTASDPDGKIVAAARRQHPQSATGSRQRSRYFVDGPVPAHDHDHIPGA